ncbi:helix-turn-helix domain-containing protein [Phenylobacterium sp.]|uniref:helix-turn-helix domain-containing protein n=1 Tax=Phenylobacterium sp. TaxID=1871053 RepID=UPI00286C1AD5|nr:helix-turn-helix domain-containing protein [Phenylobacterium sp.]
MSLTVIENQYREADGTWSFALGRPDPALAPFVGQFFEVNGVLNHSREKVFPKGDVVILFNLGRPQRLLANEDFALVREFEDAWISGQHNRHLITESPAGSWMCGVRLSARGAFRLIGESPAALANRVVGLEEVFGPRAESLVDAMRSASSPRDRFELLARLMRRRLADAPDWDPAVSWAVDALGRSQGGAPIAYLAEEIGWSRQRLHSRFIDAVGLSPKAFARVLRFQEAVQAIGGDDHPDLAAIAVQAGYYDQPHFNRDFRDFTGLTPVEYVQTRVGGTDFGFARLD